MSKLKTWLGCILLIMHTTSLMAQYPQGFIEFTTFDVQDTLITMYNKPSGDSIGAVKLEKIKNMDIYVKLEPVGYMDKIETLSDEYFITGYQGGILHLHYYKKHDNYCQIFARTKEDGFWINFKDIEEVAKTTRFIEELTEHDSWQIHGYHNYNLRTGPSVNAQVIVNLHYEKHVIKGFTGKIQGSWAEAIIYEVKEPMYGCYSDEQLEKKRSGKKYKGWIKIVDDNGQIKDIDFYRSC
jgi:hypothetical protein